MKIRKGYKVAVSEKTGRSARVSAMLFITLVSADVCTVSRQRVTLIGDIPVWYLRNAAVTDVWHLA
jgi:hypothetical protein